MCLTSPAFSSRCLTSEAGGEGSDAAQIMGSSSRELESARQGAAIDVMSDLKSAHVMCLEVRLYRMLKYWAWRGWEGSLKMESKSCVSECTRFEDVRDWWSRVVRVVRMSRDFRARSLGRFGAR